MSSAQNVPIKRPRGRMARRMLLVLLPLTLIPLVVIGATTYLYGRDFLRQQAFNLLGTVAKTQGRRIIEQVETGELLLNRALGDDEFVATLDAALALKDRQSAEFAASRGALVRTLQVTNQPKPFFNQFIILRPDGTIHIATRADWQGVRIADQAFLELLRAAPGARAGFAPLPLYYEQGAAGDLEGGVNIGAFVIMTAIPYWEQASQREGEPQAYIIGIAESATIREFIINALFYSEQVYFVTPEAQFIGLNPYPNDFNKLVALSTTDANRGTFQDNLTSAAPRAFELDASVHVHQRPVIAASAWLDELDIAWAVEVEQASVYGQIDALMQLGALLLAALLVLLGAAVWALTRNLTRPVLELADTVELFAEGNWDQRSTIERRDEVGQLSDSFNRMADELAGLYGKLESQVRERTGELNTLAQLSQIAITSKNLDQLLNVTLELLVQRFNLTYAAVFLAEQPGSEDSPYAVLRQASGEPEAIKRADLRRVRITDSSAETLAGWVIATNRALVRPLKSPALGPDGRPPQLKYFEAAVPIATSEMVLGAMNLFAASHVGAGGPEPFSTRMISELQTFANQIATAVRNFQLIEASRINLDEASMLFQSSHLIAQAESIEAAQRIAAEALEKCAFRAAILLPAGDHLMPVYYRANDPSRRNQLARLFGERRPAILGSAGLGFKPIQLADLGSHFSSAAPLVLNELDANGLPRELLDIPRQMGCSTAAFLPALQGNRLAALLVLGSAEAPEEGQSAGQARGSSAFTTLALQPYANLIELLAITIEKLRAQEVTQKRLVELETLWKVSQTISVETDLTPLFHAIHAQIEEAMGDLSTIGIGLYDAQNNLIHFPYMYEEGQVLAIQPIPLGQGLTSIVVRTRQPLLLAEDTERKMQEMGALTVGKPAQSWLGVPLLLGGEAIGVIIAQDNEREHRFNEEDQRLLSTLAAQVAGAVHNARLLETTRSRAEQERLVNEIAGKLRSSVGIQSILKTTADELAGALKLRSARIEVISDPHPGPPSEQDRPGNGRN